MFHTIFFCFFFFCFFFFFSFFIFYFVAVVVCLFVCFVRTTLFLVFACNRTDGKTQQSPNDTFLSEQSGSGVEKATLMILCCRSDISYSEPWKRKLARTWARAHELLPATAAARVHEYEYSVNTRSVLSGYAYINPHSPGRDALWRASYIQQQNVNGGHALCYSFLPLVEENGVALGA